MEENTKYLQQNNNFKKNQNEINSSTVCNRENYKSFKINQKTNMASIAK